MTDVTSHSLPVQGLSIILGTANGLVQSGNCVGDITLDGHDFDQFSESPNSVCLQPAFELPAILLNQKRVSYINIFFLRFKYRILLCYFGF